MADWKGDGRSDEHCCVGYRDARIFLAHTIGPMFTVILLPLTTVILAFCVNPLYAWVLIPIYLMISVVLPFSALKAGRGIGMRYRERLGILKSKILESVYSIRDIQNFWSRRAKGRGDPTGK